MVKTVVYIGKQPVFNLRAPMYIIFPKGVPITIDSRIMDFLPFGEFKEYTKEASSLAAEIKPILIRLPNNLIDTLCCVRALHKLREYYPETPIHALSRLEWTPLFRDIDKFEIMETYKVAPLKYYKEINSRVYKDSPIFNGGALKIHTREFCYLQHLKLMDGDNPKKPTLLSLSTNPDHIAILNIGQTMGTVWTDLGKFLSKQDWGHPVVMVSGEEKFSKMLDILRRSRYVICLGDTPYSYLAAYLGVPLFIFLKDTTSTFLYQLMMFNALKENQVLYSPFIPLKDNAIIFEKLHGLVSDVISGQPVKRAQPVREPIDITPKTVPGKKRGRPKIS